MFHMCFWASQSWDLVLEIWRIIQNFDYKYISGHVLPCKHNFHLNSNSTHCEGGGAELPGILADQLTLFKSLGADYAIHTTVGP